MRKDIHVRKRKGFTSIELLVVIAIIAILIGMLLPAIQKVRESASRMKCQNNLKQMGLAIYSFENTHQRFPGGATDPVKDAPWMRNILPFVEQQNLYNVDSISKLRAIPLYYCPSEPRPFTGNFYAFWGGMTDYVSIEGLDYGDGLGIINSNATTGRWTPVRVTDVTDGTSNTIMLGERPPAADWQSGAAYWGDFYDCISGAAIGSGFWGLVYTTNQQGQSCPPPPHDFGAGPNNINDNCSFDYLWSNHIGGANFTMGDGSVRFISYSASAIIPALATRAGGEVAEVP